jgi:tRNA modification GTPase
VFSTSDTIVAIATPPGRGGIGVVRLSGDGAHAIARRLIARARPLEPRHATLANVTSAADDQPRREPIRQQALGAEQVLRQAFGAEHGAEQAPRLVLMAEEASAGHAGAAIDQVIVTYFPAPASYTGDDVVEVSAHGSPVVLTSIVKAAIEAGARLAEPGEFTLRAFVNGRIDLMQAEAVADLIDAVTPLQARAAFDQLQGTLTRAIGEIDAALFDLIAHLEASVDFPEEGYHFVDPRSVARSIDSIVSRTQALLADARRGRLIREGLQIAIVGSPNVGKSSIFNALVGAARAIVTEVPGTTRDLVTETLDLDGLRVTLVDTAGLRETSDIVESEGVARSRQAADVADLILIVADASQPLSAGELDILPQTIHKKAVIVANKCDLGVVWSGSDAVAVSAATGQGLEQLRTRIIDSLDVDPVADRPGITNVRHIALVGRAHDAMVRARAAALGDGGSLSEEFVLADLQEARAALEEIAGKRAPDALLSHIFTRFCIGK